MQTGPGAEAPPAGDADLDIWLSGTRVPVAGAFVMLTVLPLAGDGPPGVRQAAFRPVGVVDRWDGGAWLPHRSAVFCGGVTFCEGGGIVPLGTGTPILNVSIPTGIAHMLNVGGLQPGWYRLRQEESGVTAAGVFEVTAEAVTLVDLGSRAGPSIWVRPHLLPAVGGGTTLALLGGPGRSHEDLLALDAALSPTARIDRWDEGVWTPVTMIETEADGNLSRLVTLPPLDLGAYRLVRGSSSATAAGNFWVIENAPARR